MALRIKVKPGVTQQMDDTDQPTFDQWMSRIDRLVSRVIGLSIYDLDDCRYRDWYDERIRPIHAANRALKHAGADNF